MSESEDKRIGAVEKDTEGLKADMTHVKGVVDDLGYKMDTVLSALSEHGKVSWPVIIGLGTFFVSSLAVMVSIIAVIGNMALAPVKTDTGKNEAEVQRIQEHIIELNAKVYYLERTKDSE
jgi:predicted esterase YcpF (UPF0227 family)